MLSNSQKRAFLIIRRVLCPDQAQGVQRRFGGRQHACANTDITSYSSLELEDRLSDAYIALTQVMSTRGVHTFLGRRV
jgi:hypothetical protein